ncbi:unnamed protein product [Protopolystoma xenopodis]|uniref:FATC domain-containing protein n=1 Tax=Protopolystoma xenopodis TaxID=117903 RepID=A0A3S5FBS2_9PLAT|nr:unnamed protein product [Protopolystoma xenopodis]
MRKRMEGTGQIIIDREGEQSANPLFVLGNTRALDVMQSIQRKLTGTETGRPMDVSKQVDHLLRDATSNQNLCQMYIGWWVFSDNEGPSL